MEKKPLRLKNPATPTSAKRGKDWRILIVDDDEEVHAVTRMVLGRLHFHNRGIELLSAYSAAEARQVLTHTSDIAVILLDVVMENDAAGLQLVKLIREELGNLATRIILRTGQPGLAPEEHIITQYDINDYKAKSELTAQKLFTTVIAALRSFETISTLEKTRQGLEKILDSTGTLFQINSLQQFASGVLTQLAAYLGCKPNGVICLRFEQTDLQSARTLPYDLQVLAATGNLGNWAPDNVQNLADAALLSLVVKAISEQEHQFSPEATVLYLDTGNTNGTAVLLFGELTEIDDADRRLLEVFSSKISLALANAINYQKMITADQAATTDFLTGINNRRQLLRLGVPLVAEAFRQLTPLAVAMLDIDHFKRINDNWGHDAGDLVLQHVAKLLSQHFAGHGIVARFGGEEFCVVNNGLSPERALVLFDSFRQHLSEQSIDLDGTTLQLTISIGVSTQLSNSLDNMISVADSLLYRAKQEGRNRVILV